MNAKGYLILDIVVHDADLLARYREVAGPVIAAHGGSFLVRGGALEVLDGDRHLPDRVVIAEFDSVKLARRCYFSPEYAVARDLLAAAALATTLLAEGVGAPV